MSPRKTAAARPVGRDRRHARAGARGRREARTTRSPLLDCLIAEHRHFGALLRVLESKVQQGGELSTADFYLLRDVVAYLDDYPTDVHHPTEDLLFKKLVKRKPAMKDAVRWIQRDHRTTSSQTRAVLAQLEQLIQQPSKARAHAMLTACAAFAAHQREHMRVENTQLFPAVLESLSDADWRALESEHLPVKDPLFGKVVGARHRVLYEYLVDSAGPANDALNVVGRLLSLERMVATAGTMADGAGAEFVRLGSLARAISERTRTAFRQSLRSRDVRSAVRLPRDYANGVGESLRLCGVDLLRIWVRTVRSALALYDSAEFE